MKRSLKAVLLAVCLLMISGASVYFLYSLNAWGIGASVLISSLAFFFLYPLFLKDEDQGEPISYDRTSILSFVIFVVIALACLLELFIGRSDRPLISPWQVVSARFFLFYFLASILLCLNLARQSFPAPLKMISLSLHYFLSFSAALIVYKIGYGYDPFIHQASLEIIDKQGVILPKTPYYLGQYSLIIFIHKLSGLSIALLNKLLVPVSAALFLPTALVSLARKHFSGTSSWMLPILSLIVGFSPFILTTPQNLSYLFLVLTIAAGLSNRTVAWPLLLALTTASIHPLTGIPALAWCAALYLYEKRSELSKRAFHIWRALAFCLCALILPLTLFLAGGSSFKQFNLSFSHLFGPIFSLFSGLNSAGQENWLLNLVYFFFYNYEVWLVSAVIFSLIYYLKRYREPAYQSLLLMELALIIAYLISSQISFTDLISYEQTNYASRLLILMLIFALPFLLMSLGRISQKVMREGLFSRLIWLALAGALVSISLYVSYPRIDKYFNSRGYSTSAWDIAAVEQIAQEAKSPYIVLANQQVSAAALASQGFDHYYESEAGPVYFYPIPTGGPLYQYYLKMVYEAPTKKTMEEARDLVGAKDSYLVVNKYWFQSDRVIAAAKLSSDAWRTISDQVYIFRYSD